MSNTIFIWGILALAKALGKPASEKLVAVSLTIGLLADLCSAVLGVL